MATVQSTINALYVVLYDRAADNVGYQYWLEQAGTPAGAEASEALTQSLAQQFVSTQSTYFDATYGSLSDQQFILALYSNLGGNTTGVTGQDLAYWQGQLDNFGGDRALLAGEFTLEFLNYAGSDPAGLDRQQQLYNKVAVSIDWVATSAEPGNGFMNASTPGDAAFEAETRILQGVTSDTSTLDIALDQIAAVDEFDDLALAIGQPLPVGDLRLTIGVDTPTEGFSSGNGGIIEAPDGVFDATPASNPPLGVTNTLNTGDTLIDTAGDGTINYTVATGLAALVNPPFVNGVNMDGVATANILNPSVLTAGFAGNINGLQTLNALGGSIGNLQLGVDGAGLNDPLQTINVSASVDVEVFTETSAFDGTNELDVNLFGVDTFVDLDLSGAGTDGYVAINVSSLDGPNALELDAEENTVATINVDGDQNLDVFGTALFMNTLETFDATDASGDITAFFGSGDPGGVNDLTAIGGSGNDNFTFGAANDAITAEGNGGDDVFTFLTVPGGTTTFGTEDSVDGGDGDNRLLLQANTGALLAAMVGEGIVNIQTIEHITSGFGATGNISVDMSESGSATVLDLAGDYFNGGLRDVDVTNLTSVDEVILSGNSFGALDVATLSLSHNVVGQINLTMDSTDDQGALGIGNLVVNNGTVLNLESTGNADLNGIFIASNIDASVAVTGDVDLTIGTPPAGAAYDQVNGVIDAAAFQGDLIVVLGANSQTVIAGEGDDLIIVQGANTASNHDLINLAVGGEDTVQFDTDVGAGALATNANYHLVSGFELDDQVELSLAGLALENTQNGAVAAADNPLIFHYDNGTILQVANGSAYNIILADDAVAGGGTADAGYDSVFGGAGSMVVSGGSSNVLFGYYDTANQQLVLGTADSVAGVIAAATTFEVVSLVGMTEAEYHNLTGASFDFV